MRYVFLMTLAVSLLCCETFAQVNEPAKNKYTSQKGFGFYALVQPSWYNQTALNERLATIGGGKMGKFSLSMGLGVSYLFKTGTELALDVAMFHRNYTNETYQLQAFPVNYDFVIRQSLFSLRDAKVYVLAGAGGFEQAVTIERPVAANAAFNQVLAANNASRMTQMNDYFLAGLGLRFPTNENADKQVGEYVAMELGYRHQMGDSWWNTHFAELNNSPDASFRQFYLSFKFGLFVKGKKK
jgi:hypothetical protein